MAVFRVRSVALLCSMLATVPGATIAADENKTAASPAVAAGNTATSQPSALVPVKSGFDRLDLAPLPSAQKVFIPPIDVAYAKGFRDANIHYRDSDYELTEADKEKLQQIYTKALQDWFKDQDWQVVTDQAAATLILKLRFTEFWLAAPLKESPQVRKTLADEYGRFILNGDLIQAADQQLVLRFSDRREVDRTGAALAFNSVLFWKAVEFDAQLFGMTLEEGTAKGRK